MELTSTREKFINKNMKAYEHFKFDRFEIVIYSIKGSREHGQKNEDSCGFILQGKDHLVLIVSDGMGGHKMGDVASKIVVNTIVGRSLQRKRYLKAFEIAGRIEKSHDKIRELGVDAGATAVAAIVSGDKARLFCVGDSLGLVLDKKGTVRYRTIEHSVVGFATESGMINPQEALEREDSNIILNTLGFSDTRLESSFDIDVNEDEIVFLCSDGITDMMSTEDLSQLLVGNDIKAVAERIIKKSEDLKKGKDYYDDLTFILTKKKNL